jgi:hypothetical protein
MELRSHGERQQDAIADALQELLCCEQNEQQAYLAIVGAIDSWLNYHQDELDKWNALKKKVTGSQAW